jgi:hypothetical protein
VGVQGTSTLNGALSLTQAEMTWRDNEDSILCGAAITTYMIKCTEVSQGIWANFLGLTSLLYPSTKVLGHMERVLTPKPGISPDILTCPLRYAPPGVTVKRLFVLKQFMIIMNLRLRMCPVMKASTKQAHPK